ncbi:hypothetical protein ACFPFX_37815 [Streptomyces mauvecolor]|uniref:Uncharacterized protein n=1 Tax=Streptomyces mauvecolor TaxID=58345 RepID=A0ABV9V023_9ACTN
MFQRIVVAFDDSPSAHRGARSVTVTPASEHGRAQQRRETVAQTFRGLVTAPNYADRARRFGYAGFHRQPTGGAEVQQQRHSIEARYVGISGENLGSFRTAGERVGRISYIEPHEAESP